MVCIIPDSSTLFTAEWLCARTPPKIDVIHTTQQEGSRQTRKRKNTASRQAGRGVLLCAVVTSLQPLFLIYRLANLITT